MNKKDICFLSAYQMAEKIRNQELSSREITESIINRMEKINPIINAYCTPTIELAREMAINADKGVNNNKDLGPLHGVPVSIKDLMYTKGIMTTFGSLLHKDFVPQQDAIDVKRLYDAGCVMLGKTNTPEFGYAGVTDNKVFGETKNPWHLERTSGGSSGGAGAAVASGISPLALGSDGGGSIRHPACFCGIFGIKPTFGRVPIYPSLGIAGHTISHHGPLTRYVKDAALMLDVIKGPHEADRESLPEENISYFENVEKRPKSLNILFTLDLGYAKVLDPDVEKAVENAVYQFESLGWTLEQPKLRLRPPVIAFNTLYTSMYGFDHKSDLKKSRDLMDPNFVKLVEAGLSYDAYSLVKANYKRKQFYEKFYKIFKNYDIMITPTTAIPAFELGKMFPKKINGVGVSPTGWQPFTFPFNLTGQPAATVPCGWSKDGLPIGMQIVGKHYQDLLVLQVAHAFEKLSPWQTKTPKLL